MTARDRSISFSKRRIAPRGFCTLVVIGSMVFLGMAVMAMSTLFAHEARRTRVDLAQTQLRQLLLAAVPAAQAEMAAHPQPHDATMPVPVDGASVTLHVANNAVEVQATFRGQRARQNLTFANGKLIAATLEQSGI